MLEIAVIFFSALLYRVPRGGGLGEGRTTIGRLLWAFPTAAGLWFITDNPWLLLAGFFLWAGVAPAWGKYFPTDPSGGNKKAFNIRGLLLFNPFMGSIYFKLYERDGRLPKVPLYAPNGGYTEWAELICGAITATVYVGLAHLITFYL